MKNLIGSEKQIAWANEIREEKFKYIDGKLTELARSHAPNEDFLKGFLDAVESLRSETSAKFWIENRSTGNEKSLVSKYHKK